MSILSGADPGLILCCCKILRKRKKNSNKNKCVESKGLYCRSFSPKLRRNWFIKTLARAAKLNEQRAIFHTLQTFFPYSLLHDNIKTFIKFFTGFAIRQCMHYSFTSVLEDIIYSLTKTQGHSQDFFERGHKICENASQQRKVLHFEPAKTFKSGTLSIISHIQSCLSENLFVI